MSNTGCEWPFEIIAECVNWSATISIHQTSFFMWIPCRQCLCHNSRYKRVFNLIWWNILKARKNTLTNLTSMMWCLNDWQKCYRYDVSWWSIQPQYICLILYIYPDLFYVHNHLATCNEVEWQLSKRTPSNILAVVSTYFRIFYFHK